MATVLKRRHMAKTITWRIIASFSTFLISWAITGKIGYGLAIGISGAIIKIVLYYLHERIWYKFKFGIVEKGEKNETI
jgi:uncharacterized membrane protein